MGPKPSLYLWKHNHRCHHVNTTSRNPLWSNCHNQNPKTSFSYSCGRLQPQFLHNNHFFSWSDFDSLLPRCLPVANVTTTATSQKTAITTSFRLLGYWNLCVNQNLPKSTIFTTSFLSASEFWPSASSVCAPAGSVPKTTPRLSPQAFSLKESLLSYIKPPGFWNKIILWKTSFVQCFSSLIYPYTVQKIYSHIIILSLNPTAT